MFYIYGFNNNSIYGFNIVGLISGLIVGLIVYYSIYRLRLYCYLQSKYNHNFNILNNYTDLIIYATLNISHILELAVEL